MKKFLLVIALAALAFGAKAQKIELDKVESDGSRFIFCSLESIRSMSDKVVFLVSLNAAQTKDGITLFDIMLEANASKPISVPKSGKLLIKLTDDSVIELQTKIEYTDKIGSVKNASGYVYTNYTIAPSFELTTAQIERICKGVKKIRLETSLEPIDKEFKKDKIGAIVSAEYELLKKALADKKGFSDGF